MNSALYQAQFGDPLAARDELAAQRARFERNLHEQSMSRPARPRAVPVEAVDAAFLAQAEADATFLRTGNLSHQAVDREHRDGLLLHAQGAGCPGAV